MNYFVANWKANFDLQEAIEWWAVFDNQLMFDQNLHKKLVTDQIKIIIAAPYPFLEPLAVKIRESKKNKQPYYKNIHLASQDISQFENGAYTGEVTAKSLVGLVDYIIIGHSERRTNFHDTNETVEKKIKFANKYQMTPILCIRNQTDWNSNYEVRILAFEPVEAIGTGNNISPEKTTQLKKTLDLKSDMFFLYGGSVDDNNAKEYLSHNEIDGLLIGTSSLNPVVFYKIVSNASI